MLQINISKEIKEICPQAALGCIQANVHMEEYNNELWNEINNYCDSIKEKILLKDISKLKNNKESREVYKKLGKDPTRYRLSSEALLRRILKGSELYKINNIVDINNLVSIKSFYSVGSYDLDKIKEPVIFGIGAKEEPYEGIGRGEINIENLPILRDSMGAFGSATSDSYRTMITMDTKRVLINIISFNGKEELIKYIEYTKELLKKFANAAEIKSEIIE